MSDVKQNKTRSFYSWGNVEDALSKDERAMFDQVMQGTTAGGAYKAISLPKIEEYDLEAPRFATPCALQEILTDAPEERVRHARGRSYEDAVRLLMRDATGAPDYVAYPETEDQVSAVLEWASSNNAAVVPYGGGSSVCKGVDTEVDDSHSGVISLDMARFDKVLEVDKTSRAARIQGGMLGPDLEEALRPHDLTLRHFPQSFEFSTLGGWIVTRAGGHYATLYTHIDEFVESTRIITPSGLWESRRLPGSGAGPSPDRMVLGSEGIFGVLTEAWMRIQDRPKFRGSASVFFDTMEQAGRCARAVAQSGLFPTNCRILDRNEARLNMVGDGTKVVLILGFESADHPVDPWLTRGLEIVEDHGGVFDQEKAEKSLEPESTENREGAAGKWRNSFIRGPYIRDHLIQSGVIVDTFETSTTWDRFDEFYQAVIAQTKDAIRRITNSEADMNCRLTHVYPDGAAPYFTYAFRGTSDADFASCRSKWIDIKAATNEIVVKNGGTVTHHHAVGRDHRSGYDVQTPDLYREALKASKRRLDPKNVLNPGVLIDI